MSFSSSLNPNVVKTDLDNVFMQEFESQTLREHVTAESESVFRQMPITNAAYQEETFGGIGYWNERAEEENVHESSPRITNKATYTAQTFSEAIRIPKRFFDDNMHGSYEKMVRNFASMARISRDRNAMKFWVDGFATNTTADGDNIFSNTHTTISGDTVDNLTTAQLSDTSLEDALQELMVQKDQAGVVRGSIGSVLLVPPALYASACRLADAQLRPNTANNEPNVFLTKFGIYVATSPHLSEAASHVSGADAYWYLAADNHSMTRFIRQSVETALVDYTVSANNVYVYKGEFRETYGCPDYVGLYGSTGTT